MFLRLSPDSSLRYWSYFSLMKSIMGCQLWGEEEGAEGNREGEGWGREGGRGVRGKSKRGDGRERKVLWFGV